MKTLKWGLIGAGDIARKRIAPVFRDLANCEFISVSRSRADMAEEFAKEFGAPKWFADWREQLTDDEIDAVYIATPVYLHAEQTIAAAEAGKHVLCEKPMALNAVECHQMIAACRANNVKLGIAYYRPFYPSIARAKELIASGDIGKVAVAQINAFEYFDPPEGHPRRWLLDKVKSGGGPMIDFGCHRLEVLTDLFGTVRRLESLCSNAAFDREVEDTASALLQFESGVCASLTICHAAGEPQDTLDIFGSKGSIHIRVLNQGEMRVRIGDTETIELLPPAPNMYHPLIADFVDAVFDGREPYVDAVRGRYVTELIDKLYAQNA